ncbi:putative reverse transcriptase domain-containing protein [Tanacetum coccineum]|uniref:Reverse transcriptase domain-containing protein n=1 Tax=Tanacetum coccineum TaxID=301880 RepID=A0ABQ5BFP9_9ASTR
MTTPSPSPPISLSPPSAHSSPPPAHSSPLLPSSGCPTQIHTLRIASTQALIDVVTVVLPSLPLPPLPPSLYIPPPIDRKDDIPESEHPPCKRLYLSTLGSIYEVEESSTAGPTRGRGIDYGFFSTVDAEERRHGIRLKAVPEIAPIIIGEVNTRVTEVAELHEHDTQGPMLCFTRDCSDRDNMDVAEEAYASREAFGSSRRIESATLRAQTHRYHVYAQETHLQHSHRHSYSSRVKSKNIEIEAGRTYRSRGIVFAAKTLMFPKANPDHVPSLMPTKPRRSIGNTNVANTQKGNGAAPKGNGCFECGASGHFKRDCPKLKNKDGGNRNAQGWVYAVGNAEKRKGNAPGNPDANVVTTDGKLVGIDTIIRGCTLNFLDHSFNIDPMPVELGSFDVIIGMV